MKLLLLISMTLGTVLAQDAELIHIFKNKKTAKLEKVKMAGELGGYEVMVGSRNPKRVSLYGAELDFSQKDDSYEHLSESLKDIGTLSLNIQIDDKNGNPVETQKIDVMVIPRGLNMMQALIKNQLFEATVTCEQKVKELKGSKKMIREFHCKLSSSDYFSFKVNL